MRALINDEGSREVALFYFAVIMQGVLKFRQTATPFSGRQMGSAFKRRKTRKPKSTADLH